MGPVPGTMLPCRTDDQVVRIVAVNGTHRLPDALAPLINVRRGAEGDKQTPNVTKMSNAVNAAFISNSAPLVYYLQTQR